MTTYFFIHKNLDNKIAHFINDKNIVGTDKTWHLDGLSEALCDGGDLLQAGDDISGLANAGLHLACEGRVGVVGLNHAVPLELGDGVDVGVRAGDGDADDEDDAEDESELHCDFGLFKIGRSLSFFKRRD